MIATSNEIINLIKNGGANLQQVRQLFSETSSDTVAVQDWEAYYNSDSGELGEYCYITGAAGNSIDAVGLLAYSSDGETLHCAQYTWGLNSRSMSSSVSTSLFNPEDESTMLGVLFGSMVDGTTYFIEQPLPIAITQLDTAT
jgi:hypothetical protein